MRYFITLAVFLAFGFGLQASAHADDHDQDTKIQQVNNAKNGSDDKSTKEQESEEEPDCE